MFILLLTSLAWGSHEAAHVVEHYTREYQAQCIDTVKKVDTGLTNRSIRMQPTVDEDSNRMVFKMIDKRGEQFECAVVMGTFVDGTYCHASEWGYRSGCLFGIEWIAAAGGTFMWEGGTATILYHQIIGYSAPDLIEAVNTIGAVSAPASEALTAPFGHNAFLYEEK